MDMAEAVFPDGRVVSLVSGNSIALFHTSSPLRGRATRDEGNMVLARRSGDACTRSRARPSDRDRLQTQAQWTACTSGSAIANRRPQAARAAPDTAAVSWRAMAT